MAMLNNFVSLIMLGWLQASTATTDLKRVHKNGLKAEECVEICQKQREPLCDDLEFSKNLCILLSSDGSRSPSSVPEKCSQKTISSRCPAGYGHVYQCGRFVDGVCWPSCYSISSDKSEVPTAASECRKTKGFLLSVESSGEQRHLEYVLKKKHREDKISNVDGYWTSGTNLGHEEYWIWDSTGQPITYTNWWLGEPNNQMFAEHAIEIEDDIRNFHWNDNNRAAKLRYICEHFQSRDYP